MRRLFAWLAIPLLFVFGGCGTPGNQTRLVPIAGGRVVDAQFGPNGPLPARANGFEVRLVTFTPGAQEKELVYQFVVAVPPDNPPKSIQVDDISEDAGYSLIDDQHPWQTDNLWHGEAKPITAGDPRLAWIFHVTPSMRVYRFTIVDATGRQSFLYQVAVYPEVYKMAVRHKWGEKY